LNILMRFVPNEKLRVIVAIPIGVINLNVAVVLYDDLDCFDVA